MADALEVEHLRGLVAGLECRLLSLNALYKGSLTREVRCEKCATAKQNEAALWAENDWLWSQRKELVARLIKLNDDAFAAAWVERHRDAVEGRRLRK